MKKQSKANNQESSEISSQEWLMLNQFLYEIKQINSACISVYYPYGKGQETITLLDETKRNSSMEKIETEIAKRILKLKKNPSSVGKFTKTLCIFGWMTNGTVNIRDVGTSKKLPYVYMESRRPFLKPFNDILKTQYEVLVVTVDQKSAKIQKFHGEQIIKESTSRIDLQGRHKKGGQSQGRFLRARQTKIHVFYKKVAQKTREMDSNSQIIILGGNGQAKTEFLDVLDKELVKKCRIIEGLTLSTPLSEIYKKIIQQLYQYRKNHIKEIISKYEKHVKDKLTAKRNSVIYEALKRGAVDTLIVSADYHSEPQFKNIMKMLEIAKETSAKIEFVSSPKIIKKLKIDDSVLAILRYKIK